MLLESESPPLEEIRKILADIRKDDSCASEVIRRIRALLRSERCAMLPLDLNEIADEVVQLVLPDARRRSVAVAGVGG